MAADTSLPESCEPAVEAHSESSACASCPGPDAPVSETPKTTPKMTRMELILSVLLSAVFVGFCIYVLSENPLLGLVLALVTGIISLTWWFVANVFRGLKKLLWRKKA